MELRQNSPKHRAFTLVELAALTTALGAILFVTAPALSRTQHSTQATLCRNNSRQIIHAWTRHASDHAGLLVTSLDSFSVPRNDERELFISTHLDYTRRPENWDPDLAFKDAALQPYLPGYDAWRCPADPSRVRDFENQLRPRVRSIALSQVFDFGGWLPAPEYRIYAQLSEIVLPAKTWVTMEEHPDSLMDGACAVQMAEPGATQARIIDWPANSHQGAATLNFADGHVETHPWRGRIIRSAPVQNNNSLPGNMHAGDSVPDIIWWSGHTTVRSPTAAAP